MTNKTREAATVESVGQAVGQWMRKVGSFVADVSESISVPEPVRIALESARQCRRSGEFTEAHKVLESALQQNPQHPSLASAQLITNIHKQFSSVPDDSVPHPSFHQIELNQELKPFLSKIYLDLWSAIESWKNEDFDLCLDHLRRARRQLVSQKPTARFSPTASQQDYRETELLLQTLVAYAYEKRGEFDRSIRALNQAKLMSAEHAAPALRQHLHRLGITWYLHIGDLDQALQSLPKINEVESQDSKTEGEETKPTDLRSEQLRVIDRMRIAAVQRDEELVLALLPKVQALEQWTASLRLRCALALGFDSPLAQESLAKPTPLSILEETNERTNLLAQLAHWQQLRTTPSTEKRNAVIDGLLRESQSGSRASQLIRFEEVLFVALMLDCFPPQLLQIWNLHQKNYPSQTPTLESRIFRDRLAVFVDSAAPEDIASTEGSFALEIDFTDSHAGPDEISPMRDPILRHAILFSQVSWILLSKTQKDTESSSETKRKEIAERCSQCLAYNHFHQEAHDRITQLASRTQEAQLEVVLDHTSELLHNLIELNIPADSKFQSAFSSAHQRVLRCRERVARPLTIAVMGEFSSGKSTMVNAWLGTQLAPMGVLPTTNTLTRFRNGTGPTLVHRRSGEVSMLDRDNVYSYLSNLSSSSSLDIRFVDVTIDCPWIGEAIVVDTPGLNALDTEHDNLSLNFVDQADAILWVFSATRAGAGSEFSSLRKLGEDGRPIISVLNKTDVLTPEELDELMNHLRAELGDSVIDIVPISASAALETTSDTTAVSSTDAPKSSTSRNPSPVLNSLIDLVNSHFLDPARSLKSGLTARQTRRCIIESKRLWDEMIESRSSWMDFDERALQLSGFQELATRVHKLVLELDSVLSREYLALSLSAMTDGERPLHANQPPDPDLVYLESRLSEELTSRLRSALFDLTQDERSRNWSKIIRQLFLPWAHGYLQAWSKNYGVLKLLSNIPRDRSLSESELSHYIRQGLEPIAEDWRRQIIFLRPQCRLALAQAFRSNSRRLDSRLIQAESVIWPQLDGCLRMLENWTQSPRRLPDA